MDSEAYNNSFLTVAPILILTVSCSYLLNIFFKKQVEQRKSIFTTDSVTTNNIVSDCVTCKGVNESIQDFNGLYDGARKKVGATTDVNSIEKRREEYKGMVDTFYNLVTDFYEWGWGQSFHFAPRLLGESFEHSITRAEYFLALRAGMGESHRVLDVGCGVGGPMRNICQFSGAKITGVTINEFQVNVGNKYNEDKGLDKKCQLIQGDFQKLPEVFAEHEKNFDAAYACEATCHSPNRVECFSGVFDCLKPGGVFVGYEWVMLPNKYDPKNADHVRIKEGIEVGNSLPTLTTPDDVLNALKTAGFEIVDSFDANRNMHNGLEIPWYQSLKGSWNFRDFRMTYPGRLCTHALVTCLELMRIAPSGSTKVSELLNATALDLVEGGEKQIFTPSFFFKAVKPV